MRTTDTVKKTFIRPMKVSDESSFGFCDRRQNALFHKYQQLIRSQRQFGCLKLPFSHIFFLKIPPIDEDNTCRR